MKKTLSVSIIAKNESSNIANCINSIKSIADEIIVVDTGSTDDTVEIAKKLGAKVYFKKWNYDFSEAKNAALEKCTKDWILVIDCDEAIDSEDSKNIKNLISKDDLEGYYFRLINYIGDVTINETPALRLFRNRPQYRFTSKLHEQVFPSIVSLKGDNCLKTTNIKLYHYGYDHNNVDMTKKTERNIKVLQSFNEEDKDGFFFFSLGNEYTKLGDSKKALEYFLKAFNSDSKDYGFYPYLSVNLIKLLLTFNRPLEALEKAHYFEKKLVDFREIYFLKSMCEYELFKYNKSYKSLLTYKNFSKINYNYPSFNFDNENDIDGLLNSLNKLKTEHEDGLCSTVIINKNNFNTELILKEISDLSDEIYILTSDNSPYNQYKKFTKNCFTLNEISEDKIISFAKNDCKSKWLLILKNETILDKFYKNILIRKLTLSNDDTIPLWKSGDEFIRL